MRSLIQKVTRASEAIAIGVGLIVVAAPDGWAQQKQKISYSVSAQNSIFTQQHVIDVGDLSGHQIRVFELHRTFPDGAPAFDGVRVREQWTRGLTDYIDTNGPGTVYNEYDLENGDKVFARTSLVAQSAVNPDGTRKNTATSTGLITGGTGRLSGIRGTVQSMSIFDVKAAKSETQTEIEYWMER